MILDYVSKRETRASAMSEQAHRESLAAVLAEIRAELGPANDDETAWARSVLGL
jgi:predicted N-formylglutamate amidohydrolase